MDDCITISDDESEDVQLLKHVVHIDKEPIIIDLTCSQETCMRTSAQEQGPSNIIHTPPQSHHPTTNEHSPRSPPKQNHESPEPPEPTPRSNHDSPKPPTPETVNESPQPTPTNMHNHYSPSLNIIRNHFQPQPQPPPEVIINHPQASPGVIHNPQYPMPRPSNNVPQPPNYIPQAQNNIHQPPNDLSQPSNVNPQQEAKVEDKPPQQAPKMSDYELMMAQKALGNEKYKHNLFDDAIRIYKRANELAKRLGDKEMSAILHFNLAMTYYKVGSFDQSADECANAVKINDKYIKAHLKRAEIYQRQGKFEEAVICYEHICELDSTNPDYSLLLEHAKAAAKHPKKKDYYQILGLSYNFTREDLRKAYRQQALSHHPDRHSDADLVTRRIEEKRFKEASEAHSWIKLRMGYRL